MTEKKIRYTQPIIANNIQEFSFNNPTKIIYGKGTIKFIGPCIREWSSSQNGKPVDKVLLLAGGGSIKKNGVYNEAITSLNSVGIEWVECWGVRANPVLTKVMEASKIAKDNDCQGILAIGGGSVLDSAKATIAAVEMGDKVWEAFENKQDSKKGIPCPEHHLIPLFTILTLSATGSEMNRGGVITNEKLKKKWPIFVDFPRISIVDPESQFSLPWIQVANGAADAIAHCMEQYFMGFSGQEMTIQFLNAVQSTLIKTTDIIQNNIHDYDSRANFCYACTLALNGQSGVSMNGGDWATHALEHSVSTIAPECAHGSGLAIIFPSWIRYIYRYLSSQSDLSNLSKRKIFERWALDVWGQKTVEEGVVAMENKFKKWRLPCKLTQIGIKSTDLDELVRISRLWPNVGRIKKLNEEDMKKIFEDCM